MPKFLTFTGTAKNLKPERQIGEAAEVLHDQNVVAEQDRVRVTVAVPGESMLRE